MFADNDKDKDKDNKKEAKTNKFNPPPLKPYNDPQLITTADIAVFNNKSTYNIEIHSKHKSGTKIKLTINNNLNVTQLKSFGFILFRLKPQQIVDAWNNKKAWEIVCTKPHLNLDDKPQFQILEVARPERPKRPGEPGYKPGW